MEGDDPSIFWTVKTPTGYGPNEGRTAGPFALDVETGDPITALHPAVLFDDRSAAQTLEMGCGWAISSPRPSYA